MCHRHFTQCNAFYVFILHFHSYTKHSLSYTLKHILYNFMHMHLRIYLCTWFTVSFISSKRQIIQFNTYLCILVYFHQVRFIHITYTFMLFLRLFIHHIIHHFTFVLHLLHILPYTFIRTTSISYTCHTHLCTWIHFNTHPTYNCYAFSYICFTIFYTHNILENKSETACDPTDLFSTKKRLQVFSWC